MKEIRACRTHSSDEFLDFMEDELGGITAQMGGLLKLLLGSMM